MENLSGLGNFYPVPEEVKKWNWGAFWTTFIWGFYNNTFISLLMFIPIVNIGVPFYLGAKGNELSWQNRHWKDETAFFKIQKKWAIFGWIFAIIVIPITIYLVSHQLEIRQLDKYIQSEALVMIEGNEEAMDFIGENPEIIDYIRGSYEVFAEMTYSIVIETDRGKYWGAVRLDENHDIAKIIISHYFMLERYYEVVIYPEG